MDKLPEPEFTPDKTWPRFLHGTEPMVSQSRKKYMYWFTALSAGSIYKFWREITFYNKNMTQFAVVAALFAFTSYNIAKLRTEDPFVLAAVRNNEAEKKYIEEYRNLYKEARAKGISIPNNLIL